MTELLKTVPHFNFRANLLNAIVSYMPLTHPAEVNQLTCKCIAYVFEQDESGEISFEAVKLITKMIKTRHYKVPENVLQTFLHLKLRKELELEDTGNFTKKRKKHLDKKQLQEHVSKKAKKVLKINDELELELKEAEAVYDKTERKKLVGFFSILQFIYN